MLSSPFIETISSGMNYPEYVNHITRKLEEYKKDPDSDKVKAKFDLLRLNAARSRRIENTYIPSEELKELISNITEKQTWMIISEPWCGDSAQNIPFISAMAALNPLIELKFLFRDQNLEIMDLYLTNGARSIPILVAFDKEWNELFRWGSRPSAAKEVVLKAKSEGADKDAVQEKLHTWYANNKGNDITSEFVDILRTILTTEIF